MERSEAESYHPGSLIPWEHHRIEVLTPEGTFLGRFLVIYGEEKGIDPPVLILDQPEEQQIRNIPVNDIISITRILS